MNVGLFPTPSPTGAIGTVTDADWQGMRHHDIANVRGLYYEADQTLAIWEVDAWGRLDEYTQGRLWQLFETFLLTRFPAAVRIFADDAEPGEAVQRKRYLLQSLGYEHVAGTHRIVAKEVGT